MQNRFFQKTSGMKLIKHLLLFIILGLLFTPISAKGQTPKDTLQYKIGLDISGRKISGTFKQTVAGGGINLDLLYNNWHLESKTTYRYNKTFSNIIEDNWYELVTLKYYVKGSKKLYPGVFYHFDNSLIYRVKSRHQYGIGFGSVLDKGNMKLSILAAIANEQSTFNGSEFVNSERDFSIRDNGLFLLRINNGYAFAKNKINFGYQLFYFQSLKESADYDLWISPKIRFKVWKGLSLHVVYDYRFENVHLETLSNYNDILLFGFNWQLKG